MDNVHTWLKLAKNQKLHPLVFVPEKVNTLAISVVTIPENYQHSKDSTAFMGLFFLRDGVFPVVSDLCYPNVFASKLEEMERALYRIRSNYVQTLFLKDGHLQSFKNGTTENTAIQKQFKCNKGFFVPEIAMDDILAMFNKPLIEHLKQMGVDLVTLNVHTLDYQMAIKFL